MEPDEAALFIDAQDGVWPAVIAELTAGRKTSHWMWFVFPQLASLGRSDMSQLFGLHDLNEARDYLAHPVLGARLLEVTKLVLTHEGTDPVAIFGKIDARKLQSSMTLFERVKGAPKAFSEILDTFYGGQRCAATIAAVGGDR